MHLKSGRKKIAGQRQGDGPTNRRIGETIPRPENPNLRHRGKDRGAVRVGQAEAPPPLGQNAIPENRPFGWRPNHGGARACQSGLSSKIRHQHARSGWPKSEDPNTGSRIPCGVERKGKERIEKRPRTHPPADARPVVPTGVAGKMPQGRQRGTRSLPWNTREGKRGRKKTRIDSRPATYRA